MVDRLVEEIEADEATRTSRDGPGDAPSRPVLPNAAPRLVTEASRDRRLELPPGVCLVANAYLVHHDPEIYPDPYAFRPERFLEEPPGTYTWIPFGGGRRRCMGASFATLEMKIVLRAVLAANEVGPTGKASS